METLNEFDSQVVLQPNDGDKPQSLSARIFDCVVAIMVWMSTLLLLAFIPLFFLIPYASRRGVHFGSPDYVKNLAEFSLHDSTAIFLQVLATLPAHLLTFAIVWAVVTRFGRRSFKEAIGWSWGKYFGPASSIAIGISLFLGGIALAYLLGGDKPTQLEQILYSSPASKYTIVFLATFTAPFAEEFVYRGVVYSSLENLIGKVFAAIIVLALFTIVHVPQYLPNYGVIAAVGLLSVALTVVRAVSGKLLPCIVIHFVFNGIQSALILAGVSGPKPPVTPDPVTGIIQPVFHLLRAFI